jgi:hypothetical protein
MGADVREGGVDGRESLRLGGRHVGPPHDLLRERLGRLELCGGCPGPEYGSPLGAEPVGQPARERCFRPDDG